VSEVEKYLDELRDKLAKELKRIKELAKAVASEEEYECLREVYEELRSVREYVKVLKEMLRE